MSNFNRVAVRYSEDEDQQLGVPLLESEDSFHDDPVRLFEKRARGERERELWRCFLVI